MVIAIDGPAGAGKSTVARGVAQQTGLHLHGQRRDVPLRGAAGTRLARSDALAAGAGARIELGGGSAAGDRAEGGAAGRPRRDRGDPHAGGLGEGFAGRLRPGCARGAGRVAAGAVVQRRLGGRGSGHRHGGRSRCRAEGLPHRRSRRAGAPARRGARPRSGGGAGRTSPTRPARLRARAQPAAGGCRCGDARHHRARCRRRGRAHRSAGFPHTASAHQSRSGTALPRP